MKKNKIKPTSVRFSEDLLEGIDLECQDRGCSRNDFVIESLEEKLEGKSEEQEPKPMEPKPAIGTIETGKDGSKYKLESIQDNGAQIWIEV